VLFCSVCLLCVFFFFPRRVVTESDERRHGGGEEGVGRERSQHIEGFFFGLKLCFFFSLFGFGLFLYFISSYFVVFFPPIKIMFGLFDVKNFCVFLCFFLICFGKLLEGLDRQLLMVLRSANILRGINLELGENLC
jgi:hypothetical protein